MTGIDRDYQGQGIGFELKRSQRDWALANGFDEIRWTFDPLQSGNAKFNLHLLGAAAARYYPNFYGVMADDINKSDLPSDRIEAVWRLRDPRVEQRLAGAANDEDTSSVPALLIDKGLPHLLDLDPAQPAYRAQIPRRLPQFETLLAWRLALRSVLTNAFEQGYFAVDFTNASAYLLHRA
jgi:predicted GNAT superfamily acetyltransferase